MILTVGLSIFYTSYLTNHYGGFSTTTGDMMFTITTREPILQQMLGTLLASIGLTQIIRYKNMPQNNVKIKNKQKKETINRP